MVFPEYEDIVAKRDHFRCQLAPPAFSNVYASVDGGQINLRYRCENTRTGSAFDTTVSFYLSNEQLSKIREQLARDAIDYE